MSPPHFGVGAEEEEGQSSAISVPAILKSSTDSLLQSTLDLKERNYMGISDCSSSVDSSTISATPKASRSCMNLKATELRLGLPGSQSPERYSSEEVPLEINERPLFPLHPLRDQISFMQKNVVSGNKRGFSDAMNSFAEAKGKVCPGLDVKAVVSPCPSSKPGVKPSALKENDLKTKEGSSMNETATEIKMKKTSAPAPKTQVVGWPPVRKSLWKNSATAASKNTSEVDEKSGPAGSVFVKVSMDGAPYLRKIDLGSYKAYQELSCALETMFSCFTIGQCASHGATGKDVLSESKLKDLLHGSEYVLTYEDKDGDWMLVGDVPWEMFTDNCKRLRIMKGSDAIGLAPRAMEKCRNRS